MFIGDLRLCDTNDFKIDDAFELIASFKSLSNLKIVFIQGGCNDHAGSFRVSLISPEAKSVDETIELSIDVIENVVIAKITTDGYLSSFVHSFRSLKRARCNIFERFDKTGF